MLLKLLVALFVVAIFCSALCRAEEDVSPSLSDDDTMLKQLDVLKQWTAFKLENNRTYSSKAEEEDRFKIFSKTLKEILKFNLLPGKSFKMRMNHFGDWTPAELSKMNGVRIPASEKNRTGIDPAYLEDTRNFMARQNLPSSIDWRRAGAVSPVKQQGQCASCYTFSANGALEGMWKIKTGTLLSLSEQNLVDCTRGEPYNNGGCNRGWMHTCWQYVQNNGGINPERTYPYEGRDGACRYWRQNNVATVSGWANVPKNEYELMRAVAYIGPVSVAIDVPNSLYYHGTGIYDVPCGRRPEHAILVVGYGTEGGRPFWIIKNSWGTGWGDQGFARLARGKNLCGIADWASYPRV